MGSSDVIFDDFTSGLNLPEIPDISTKPMKRTTLPLFRKLTLLFVPILLGFGLPLRAQFIDVCEPPDNVCPSVCGDGVITVRIFHLQRLTIGAHIQAQLSNANGTFNAGTQRMEAIEYKSNGSSNYQPGPIIFQGDMNEVFAKFKIPAGTPMGTNYTLRIRSTRDSILPQPTGFRCGPGGNNGRISIIQGGNTLPPVAQNVSGDGKWIGHIYSWNPTIGGPINTDALVNAQDFYNPSRYQGHTVYDNLNLDIEFDLTGGIPGSTHNGTSLGCGSTLATNFSMRLRRTENFAPGRYKFFVGGDDGIRFSVDGGATWLIGSYYDQEWQDGQDSTRPDFPNGICLSGPTNLVIEYFQHNVQARLTFRARRIDPPINHPQPQTVCVGAQDATFQFGVLDPSSQYQWQVSTDNGGTFQNITNGPQYSGTNGPSLTVLSPTAVMNGYLYRCILNNACGNAESDPAILNVTQGTAITGQPQEQTTCPGQAVQYTVVANGATGYTWQANSGAGFADITLSGFSGMNTATLSVDNPTAQMNGWLFRCVVTGAADCGGRINSDEAALRMGQPGELDQQPQPQTTCPGQPVQFSVAALNATGFQWQANSGTGFVNIAIAGFTGVATPTLSVDNPTAQMEGWLFRCVVTGPIGCGAEIVSNEAALRLRNAPEVGQQPVDKEWCNGQPVVFEVTSPLSSATFRWQVSMDGGQIWSDVTESSAYAGSQTASLTVSDLPQNSNEALFRALVHADCGNDATSQAARLTRCCTVKGLTHILTVNGDDLNRTLGKIDCAVTGFSMTIYNRWGKKIYTSTVASTGWDAQNMPEGTYFYRVSYAYQGQATTQNGFVEVVR